MRFWIALAVIAQLLDAATFMLGVHKVGMWAESNPFIHWQYEWSGMEGVLVAKAIVILILILASVWRPHRFGVARVTAVVIGLLGVATNLTFGVLA